MLQQRLFWILIGILAPALLVSSYFVSRAVLHGPSLSLTCFSQTTVPWLEIQQDGWLHYEGKVYLLPHGGFIPVRCEVGF